MLNKNQIMELFGDTGKVAIQWFTPEKPHKGAPMFWLRDKQRKPTLMVSESVLITPKVYQEALVTDFKRMIKSLNEVL